MRPPDLLDTVIGGLAVARLARLITADTITRPARDWVTGRWPALGAFLGCPWCVGVWAGFGWAALDRWAPEATAFLGRPLAWSEAAGLLAELAG